jgi:DNA modification methylase
VERTKELKIIAINELVPYVNNARTHNKEQITKLRSSLREFGFINPILIDKDKNIIAGHGRVLAAKEEGINEVPCVLVEHLTDAQKKAYIIADNKLALDAGWDEELLALEIQGLKDLDFDINFTGFDAAEIDDLFSKVHDKEIKEDDFDVEEALKEPIISKHGDVWLLGRHRLICEDSTEAKTYEVLMEGKKANLVVTDPPYNVAYEGTAGKIQNDNMADKNFYEFLLKFYKCTFEAMADGAPIYVFHADKETVNFRTAFKDAGFFCHETCVWVKNSPVLGRCDYQYNHEPILYGWKPTAGHKFYSDRKQRTTWNFDRPTKSELHPTMKPLNLIAYPIKNSSLTNCIVLDPFGGSGSTLIACEQTNRICFTIELDEKYADVIVKRYIDQVGSDDGVFLIRESKKIRYKDVTESKKNIL